MCIRDRNNSVVLANRALARYNLRDFAGAKEDARRSLEINPSRKLALEVQEKLAAGVEPEPEDPQPAQVKPPAKTQTKPGSKPQTKPAAPRPSAKSSGRASGATPVTLNFEFPGQFTWRPPAKRDDPTTWPKQNVLWQKAQMPDLEPKGPGPMDIPLHLEFGKLTHVAYAAAITTAKEALRLIYGIMTPEETQRYEAKWAPYYDYPTKEIIDYLNKLNPLLVRFLEARAGYAAAAKGTFIALCEAGMAEGYGFTDSFESAWDTIHFYKRLTDAYEDAMKKTVAEILALGDMPNPYAIRAAHRKRFKEAVDAVKNMEEEEEDEGGRYYVLTKIDKYPYQKPSDEYYTRTFNFQEGLARGSFHNPQLKGGCIPKESSGTVTWEPFPRLIKAAGGIKTKIKASVSMDSFEWLPGISDQMRSLTRTMTESLVRFAIGRDEGYDGSVGIPAYQGAELTANPDTTKREGTLDPNYFGYFGGGEKQVVIACQARTPGGSVTFHYTYELRELTADQVTEIRVGAFDDKEDLKKTEGDLYDISDAQIDDARTRASNIQYQIETAAYFKKRTEQIRQELKRTTDKDARGKLSWQLMACEADMQAAQDSRTYLETGQWVRTRTLFDDYNFMRMEELAQETARKAMRASRRVTSAEKLIKILPYPQKTAARKIFEKAYISSDADYRDDKTMEDANREIASMVSGYFSTKRREAMDEERHYKYLQWTAQGVQIAAGIVFIGAAGAAVAGAGGTATMIWAADVLAGAAYGGATGYAEGGSEQALKQSLEWAGTIGFTLSQGIEGYKNTGTVSGGIKRGAVALAFAKGLEYGIKYLRGFGKAAEHVPPGAPNINAEEFRKGLDHGRQLCRNLERAEWELAEALSKGGNQETIERLTNETTEIAADINASWHAKYFLKQQGPSIVGSSFTKRIEQVYDKMMPELMKNLDDMGYDVSRIAFSSTRNASNRHSVSMDLDLALRETDDMVIRMKDGKQVSLAHFQNDAQKCLNSAYSKVTGGRSAEASLINLTTSQHKEAFVNTLLLKGGDDIPWNEVSRYDIAQAGDVWRTKMQEAGGLPRMEALVEQSRAAGKEMNTKFLPYLREKIYRTRTGGNPQLANRMEKSLQYWETINRYYERIGRTETDPGTIWRLTQEVKHFTGGKGPSEVVDIMATFWEGMARLTN